LAHLPAPTLAATPATPVPALQAEGPSKLSPAIHRRRRCCQQTAASVVAPPRLRPASEAYGGVRPVRVEQRL